MTIRQIETSRFGTVEVEEAKILCFVAPILGFEHLKNYVLLERKENFPFTWLQSPEDPELAFVLTNPKFFAIPYEFALPDEAVEQLGIEKAEDVQVFTIVNIPNDDPTKMTANLLAPVVINQLNFQAMQVILQDASLSTRTRLLPDKTGQAATETPASSSKPSGKG